MSNSDHCDRCGMAVCMCGTVTPRYQFTPITPVVGAVTATMFDRVARLREWANGRIAECRRQENKFKPHTDTSHAAVEERRTLEAVLRLLDGGEA